MQWFWWVILTILVIVVLYLVAALWAARQRQWMRESGDLPGEPIDVKEAMDQIARGTRPGLVEDGSYWIFLCIEAAGHMRLMREAPLDASDVEDLLTEMAKVHGVAPTKEKRDPLDPDGLSGMYRIKGPRHRYPEWLIVVSPKVVGSAKQSDALRRDRGR